MVNNNPNHIDPRPKRRKAKDNPYNIFTVGIETNEPHYYVSFIDTQGVPICMEISKGVYETLNQFELDDLSYLNEMDNHYHFSELTDEVMYKRSITSTDDTIENISRYEKLHKAIKQLSKVQQKRLRYYYFDGYTLEEIAVMEGVSFQAISTSIRKAEKILKKFLKEG